MGSGKPYWVDPSGKTHWVLPPDALKNNMFSSLPSPLSRLQRQFSTERANSGALQEPKPRQKRANTAGSDLSNGSGVASDTSATSAAAADVSPPGPQVPVHP